MTVVYELGREHERSGGESRVVVGRGTRHDYPVGTSVEVEFPPLPSRGQKLVDAGFGRLGLPRHFGESLYDPALAAIEAEFDGPLLVHNNPAPVRMLRRKRERAHLCLYLHNVVFRPYSRREVRKVLSSADLVVCVSDFIAADLERRARGLRERIAVVHNGIDLTRFQPAPGAAAGEQPVVLFLGRVIPEKGVDLLLRAARKIAGRERPFKVRVVGSSGFSASDPLSPYERDLRAIAEPIRERVEFVPFLDRAAILEEYRAASVFCVPSNWDDPCPLTMLEGLASGLPTIAARRGGIPEIGRDAALYFQPPDVDRLAEHLAHLVDDDGARSAWGARARARAEELSWANQYLVLRRALGEASDEMEEMR